MRKYVTALLLLVLTLMTVGCFEKDQNIAIVEPTLKTNDMDIETNIDTTIGGVPAFPGAEGFGKNTRGAYALFEQTSDPKDLPRIMKVTSLEDSGPLSLRSCLRAYGPRVCLISVDGTINLKSKINVDAPYLTLIGQTAPGDGVVVKGNTIVIRASEVIVRNMRFRLGIDGNAEDDSMAIRAYLRSLNNIIFDHASFSWGRDENTGINSGSKDPYTVENVTFMRSMMTEGLTPHSMGILLNTPEGKDWIRKISVIGNLMANNNGRYPNVGGNGSAHEVEVLNNIAYQWDAKGADVKENSTVHFIGNLYKPGPNTRDLHRAIEINDNEFKVYVQGNVATIHSDQSGPAPVIDGDNGGSMLFEPSDYTVVDVSQLDTVVGDRAGAFPRDAADQRVVHEYRTSKGSHIASELEVGGYPILRKGIAVTDSDDDGMPDTWEIEHGLNHLDPSDANVGSGNGYSNLEVYVNSFFDIDGNYIATHIVK